jgi:hypothetical protein
MYRRKPKSNYTQLYEPLRTIATDKVEDDLDNLDISIIFNTKNKQTMKKTDFKNEVEQVNTQWYKFEEPGQCIIVDSCKAVVKTNQKGEQETNFHVTSETDDIFILPNHHNLNKKLATLCASGYDFTQGALITYLGEDKHPTDKLKTIKSYSVKTK